MPSDQLQPEPLCPSPESQVPTFEPSPLAHENSLLCAYQFTSQTLSYFEYILNKYRRPGDQTCEAAINFVVKQKQSLSSWGDAVYIQTGILDRAYKAHNSRQLSSSLLDLVSYSERIVDWFEKIQPPGTDPAGLRREMRKLEDAVERDVSDNVDLIHLAFLKSRGPRYRQDGTTIPNWPVLKAGTGERLAAAISCFDNLSIIMRVIERSRNVANAWIRVSEGKMTCEEAAVVWFEP